MTVAIVILVWCGLSVPASLAVARLTRGDERPGRPGLVPAQPSRNAA